MSTTVICPSCNTRFEPTEAIAQSVREELRKEFNQKYADEMKKKDDLFKQRETAMEQQRQQMELMQQQQEAELKRRLESERDNLTRQLMQQIQSDFEDRLKLMEEERRLNDEKLKEARQKEIEFLKQMQDLKAREQEIELQMQHKLLEERSKLSELIKKEEEEKNKLRDAEYQMRLKEMEKQLDDQRKLAEEMRRKAEQGSMQLQGEVQELALEELLRYAFPFDLVTEVGKGVRGADCILTVRNSFGQECGKIIFESKRTKDFSAEWIEKLKTDMRSLGIDVAVLVTQAMPKGMECFGEKDGVWICRFGEVQGIVSVLRDLVMKVYSANKMQENKGDKMTLLYSYLISHEFSGQWKAIREGFMNMKISIQRERDQMEKLWKAREKQLDKILLNAAHIKGSIEGIAGMEDAIDLNLTTEDDSYLLD